MAPLSSRTFDPATPSSEFYKQWRHPSEVFSVLLLLGGDVVARAIAQLVGGWITPVAFSFGWVAYAVTAVVSAVGDNKLLPPTDCPCKVINAKNGYTRDNTSWVIGRLVRDYESWMAPEIRSCVASLIEKKWEELRKQEDVPKPKQVGLCVSFYTAEKPVRVPAHDWVFYSGFFTVVLQLGIASIPCGVFGDWGILMITICGTILTFATGSLPQWREEKWACREVPKDRDNAKKSRKSVILTRGNGGQHAIVITAGEGCLDLEDLALGQMNADIPTSWTTRIGLLLLATLWVLLLITSAGIETNTWYLLGVGGVGIVQNIISAGARRGPAASGIPLTFERVVGDVKVMRALYAVDEVRQGAGRALLDTFFPGGLKSDEEKSRWAELDSQRPKSES